MSDIDFNRLLLLGLTPAEIMCALEPGPWWRSR